MCCKKVRVHRKRQKTVNDYSKKYIDDFYLIVVDPSPKLTDKKNQTIVGSFGSYYHDQIIEINSRRIMTNNLRR